MWVCEVGGVPAPGRSRLRAQSVAALGQPESCGQSGASCASGPRSLARDSWAIPRCLIERTKVSIPDRPVAPEKLRSEPGHHATASCELCAGAVKARRPRRCGTRGRSAATSLDGAEHSSKIDRVMAVIRRGQMGSLVRAAAVCIRIQDLDNARARDRPSLAATSPACNGSR